MDEIEIIGLGRMNMSLDDLYDLNFKQFLNKLYGFNLEKQDREEMNWLRERRSTVAISNILLASPHFKKGQSIKEEDFYKLRSEENQLDIELTEEQKVEQARIIRDQERYMNSIRKGLKLPIIKNKK